MDSRLCEDAFKLAQGVDLPVCESTYLHRDVKMAKENHHMTATEAATVAKEAGVKPLLIPHFSQRYSRSQDFQEEAEAIFENCVAARNGQRLDLRDPTAPPARLR